MSSHRSKVYTSSPGIHLLDPFKYLPEYSFNIPITRSCTSNEKRAPCAEFRYFCTDLCKTTGFMDRFFFHLPGKLAGSSENKVPISSPLKGPPRVPYDTIIHGSRVPGYPHFAESLLLKDRNDILSRDRKIQNRNNNIFAAINRSASSVKVNPRISSTSACKASANPDGKSVSPRLTKRYTTSASGNFF